MNETIETTDKWLLPVDEAIRLSGLTRTHLYGALAAGRVEARKAGRRTLFVMESLRNYTLALPRGEYGKQGKAA